MGVEHGAGSTAQGAVTAASGVRREADLGLPRGEVREPLITMVFRTPDTNNLKKTLSNKESEIAHWSLT